MNKYWFKPKGLGYGATPTTWEGWAMIVIFVLLLYSITISFIPDQIVSFYVVFIVLLILFILLVKKKTEGKLHWSWGRK